MIFNCFFCTENILYFVNTYDYPCDGVEYTYAIYENNLSSNLRITNEYNKKTDKNVLI